jgi:hypothetical protein
VIAAGLYVVKDPWVPLGRPDRRAMKRWILWGSFFGRPRPAPREQIVRIGNVLHVRPETFERLRKELRGS